MCGSYQIVEVSPDWRIAVEEMGSKEKFWYRNPEIEIDQLFKFPQVNTGQHWAEKIAAEIAAHLGILHAKVELADFRGTPGSVAESFAGKRSGVGSRQSNVGTNRSRVRSRENVSAIGSHAVEYLARHGRCLCPT